MKRIFLLLFLAIASFEWMSGASVDRRYILWKFAALKPERAALTVDVVPGKIIRTISRMYKDETLWLRFFYPGRGYIYIPEEYTLAVPSSQVKTIHIIENSPDHFDVSPINTLPYHYKPADMQPIPVFSMRNRTVFLRKTAAMAFFRMARDAELEGLHLTAYRGYTSAMEQAKRYYTLLETYRRREYFPFSVEIPTASILQTGLAVDITSVNVNNKCEFNFFFTQEYKWLLENGPRYGFYAYGGSHDDFNFKPYRFRYYYNSKFARPKTAVPSYYIVDLYGIAKLIIKNKYNAKLTYFKVHDEETVAAHTIKYIYNRYGGRMIDLINTSWLNKRNLRIPVNGKSYYIDPNRIFTEAGIKKMRLINRSLEEDDFKIAEALVRKIRDKILRVLKLSPKVPFLYVHTNHFDTVLDIHYLARMSQRGNHVFDIYYNPVYHPKIFTYVIQRADFEYLKKNGITVVLQKWTEGVDDGSLSIYAQNHIPRLTYATIEAMNEDPEALTFIADKTVQYFFQKNRR